MDQRAVCQVLTLQGSLQSLKLQSLALLHTSYRDTLNINP